MLVRQPLKYQGPMNKLKLLFCCGFSFRGKLYTVKFVSFYPFDFSFFQNIFYFNLTNGRPITLFDKNLTEMARNNVN